MSKPKETKTAQSNVVEGAEDKRALAHDKDKKVATGSRNEDLPGAEGPLSAGANEDTYD